MRDIHNMNKSMDPRHVFPTSTSFSCHYIFRNRGGLFRRNCRTEEPPKLPEPTSTTQFFPMPQLQDRLGPMSDSFDMRELSSNSFVIEVVVIFSPLRQNGRLTADELSSCMSRMSPPQLYDLRGMVGVWSFMSFSQPLTKMKSRTCWHYG
jgi:hypothetical protein